MPLQQGRETAHMRTRSHPYMTTLPGSVGGMDVDSDSVITIPRLDVSSGSLHTHTSSQSLNRHRNNLSTLSLSSRISHLPNRISTLEAYDLIYGVTPASPDTIDRLYETHAGTHATPYLLLLSALFEPDGSHLKLILVLLQISMATRNATRQCTFYSCNPLDLIALIIGWCLECALPAFVGICGRLAMRARSSLRLPVRS
jgi:hypothetical protein